MLTLTFKNPVIAATKELKTDAAKIFKNPITVNYEHDLVAD